VTDAWRDDRVGSALRGGNPLVDGADAKRLRGHRRHATSPGHSLLLADNRELEQLITRVG
jgi:hypothetical protein